MLWPRYVTNNVAEHKCHSNDFELIITLGYPAVKKCLSKSSTLCSSTRQGIILSSAAILRRNLF